MQQVHLSNDEASSSFVIVSGKINVADMKRLYCIKGGLPAKHTEVITTLTAPGKKKVSIADLRHYLNSYLVPAIEKAGAKYVLVSDGATFKELAGVAKTDAYYGYVLDSKYGDWKVALVPNHTQHFHDPVRVEARVIQAIEAVKSHTKDEYTDPGSDIFIEAHYPKGGEIIEWIKKLGHMEGDLTFDTETYSLSPHRAGIGTIAFSWKQGHGVAFPVDAVIAEDGLSHSRGKNLAVRSALKSLFKRLAKQNHKIIAHNFSYDASVIIASLFMDDVTDTEGLLEGLEVLGKCWDCTQLITYLATNSCAGNKLSLKENSQEYSGNYSIEEINDINLIDMPKLLRYNMTDVYSTWYVLNKHKPTMITDKQEDVYNNIFKKSALDMIQMQLTGLPINMDKAKQLAVTLQQRADKLLAQMLENSVVRSFLSDFLYPKVADKWNNKWKVKRITPEEAANHKDSVFNPNSDDKLQWLFYNYLSMPVIDLTESKEPSTGDKTLKKLRNHTKDAQVIALIDLLREYKKTSKVISAFIPAFLDAIPGKDGWHYLCGSFKLGGTKSGRLASSDPNLQNLPAKGELGKMVKAIFEAPSGWLLCGLDFASLEDRISALTTKDPNKLKVYTDGYDGHSLRAYAYWSERMPDIDPSSVESINSIAELYSDERGDSKAPTFALTYQGTFATLMTNCGFSEEEAKSIEANFQKLYVVSIEWVRKKLEEASHNGYVELAFGLRLRTPVLKQSLMNSRYTPKAAMAEGRTAGNALGQSWCLLNNRAAIEFMEKVRISEYRLEIRPCAHIHDAQYYLVKDSLKTLTFTNINLVDAVNWNHHPDIYHPEVGLGGELSVFYPTWAQEYSLPNRLQGSDIRKFVKEAIAKANAKKSKSP